MIYICLDHHWTNGYDTFPLRPALPIATPEPWPDIGSRPRTVALPLDEGTLRVDRGDVVHYVVTVPALRRLDGATSGAIYRLTPETEKQRLMN